MSHKLTWAALLLFSILLLGCGGGDEAGDGAAAPPAPPPAPAAPTTGGNTELADNDTDNTDPQPGGNSGTDNNTTNNNAETTGGGNTTTVAAEGALAPHAKALSIVRPDHYAIVKFDLEGARQAELLKGLPGNPEELAQELAGGGDAVQAAEMLTGVDVLWVSIGPPTSDLVGDAPPYGMGAYARFKSPEALQKSVSELVIVETVEATHSDVKYVRPKIPGTGPVYLSKGVELFISTDEPTIHQIIDAQGKIADVPLLAKLKDANLDTHVLVAGSLGPMREPVTGMLSDAIKQANEAGIPLAATTAKLPAQIEFGTIAIHLEGDTLIDIDLDMDKPANAEVMKETLIGLLSIGKLMLGQQGAQLPDDPAAKAAFDVVMNAVNAIKIEQADIHVDVSLAKIEGLDKLPEILAAAQGAAEASGALNDGKMIALAALNYHDATGKTPANIKDADGKDILSWRVAINSHWDGAFRVGGIRTEESWDSESNKEWHSWMPSAFASSADKDAPIGESSGTTTWKMLPSQPSGMWFIAGGEGSEVPWMKPDVCKLDIDDLAASLGEMPEEGYVVVFNDGSVRRMVTDEIQIFLDEAGGDPDPKPTAPAARTWTTADGKNTVEATFVKLLGDKVTLKRSDTGKEVTLPVNLLSEADQAYLKSMAQ